MYQKERRESRNNRDQHSGLQNENDFTNSVVLKSPRINEESNLSDSRVSLASKFKQWECKNDTYRGNGNVCNTDASSISDGFNDIRDSEHKRSRVADNKCDGFSSISTFERSRFWGRVFGYNTKSHRKRWQETYSSYLEIMYEICNKRMKDIKGMSFSELDFNIFCDLIYSNSTGEIIPIELL